KYSEKLLLLAFFSLVRKAKTYLKLILCNIQQEYLFVKLFFKIEMHLFFLIISILAKFQQQIVSDIWNLFDGNADETKAILILIAENTLPRILCFFLNINVNIIVASLISVFECKKGLEQKKKVKRTAILDQPILS
ncbi:hypothetical protein RFI_34542, partial [Reticulomyxa filosa]